MAGKRAMDCLLERVISVETSSPAQSVASEKIREENMLALFVWSARVVVACVCGACVLAQHDVR